MEEPPLKQPNTDLKEGQNSPSWFSLIGEDLLQVVLSIVSPEEVVNMVLVKPIRPHFAFVSIGRSFSLKTTHQLV
ncbi:hypothetical protein GIB67_038799 [Kingdonia uniflora]|uniref:Uncharacterized protein n=1 Tax=Kingdonia uniflora TaxID=39325 RepID=A0A7J7M0W3_9MAGN|nr:hypothetical protein GIB67_038799 [Kingdonia uniflora]